MIFSENRFPPRIKPGAGFFGIMLQRGLGAARLVSTPSRCRAWLGIAVERFPRVWAVLRPRFPAAHSKRSSPLRLPFRHARVARTAIARPPGLAKARPALGPWDEKSIDKPILSTIYPFERTPRRFPVLRRWDRQRAHAARNEERKGR